MSAAVEEWPTPSPVLRRMGHHAKACRVCGWRFFTVAGLHEHEDAGGCTPPGPAQTEAAPIGAKQTSIREPSAAQAALQDTGRRVAALNNSRRRRCDGCGHESTAPGIGLHQKYHGHTGWTAVP